MITFIVICVGFIGVLLLPILGMSNSTVSLPKFRGRRTRALGPRNSPPDQSQQMVVDVIDPVTHLPVRGRVVLVRDEHVVVFLPLHGRTIAVSKKNVAPAS